MTDERATEYRRLYEARLSKRLTTRHEKGILERLLATQGHCRSLLDIPCGNGRVSAPLAAATDLLIEDDTGLGQIRTATRKSNGSPNMPKLQSCIQQCVMSGWSICVCERKSGASAVSRGSVNRGWIAMYRQEPCGDAQP